MHKSSVWHFMLFCKHTKANFKIVKCLFDLPQSFHIFFYSMLHKYFYALIQSSKEIHMIISILNVEHVVLYMIVFSSFQIQCSIQQLYLTTDTDLFLTCWNTEGQQKLQQSESININALLQLYLTVTSLSSTQFFIIFNVTRKDRMNDM